MVHYTTVREFLNDCYVPLKLRGKSVHAARLHRNTLNNFAKYLGREPVWSDLSDITISKFLCWLRSRGRSPVTANDNLCRLMALARFGLIKKQIDEVPIVTPEIEPERAPMAWMPEEMERLLRTCAAQSGVIGAAPASIWWVALHLVCLFTGERITAVLSTKWSQVDLATGWLHLTAEQRKGKRRDKQWQLPPEVVSELTRLRVYAKTELIFEYGFHWGTVYNWYKKLLKEAGLPNDRRSKFHRIRRSTASYFAAAGGNATALLDHSSPQITKKYLDSRIVKEPSAADLITVPQAARDFASREVPKPTTQELLALKLRKSQRKTA